jgi:hypothetical protein
MKEHPYSVDGLLDSNLVVSSWILDVFFVAGFWGSCSTTHLAKIPSIVSLGHQLLFGLLSV